MIRRLKEILEKEKREVLQRKKEGVFRRSINLYRNTFVLLMGVTIFTLGIILLFTYYNLNEIVIPYKNGITNIPFTINKASEYKMYIQIDQFNQNYLYYSKSISTKQLKGEATYDLSKCKPIETSGNKVIYPCGLIANSFLQDSFDIIGKNISTKDITWSSEINNIKKTKYSLEEISAPPLWLPYKEIPNLHENERFANWISLAPFDNFRKLYGKVYLEKGSYTLVIDSKYPYGNTKVVFAQTSWAGVKNIFLAVLSICVGLFVISGALFLLYFINNDFYSTEGF